MASEFFRSPLPWGFNGEKFFLYCINTHLSNFGYCLASIVLKFTDLLFPSKDLFHSILTIIFFCLKWGTWNGRSFYMSPKSGFLQSKTYMPCPLLIVMRPLKFLESIPLSTTVTSSRHDENRMEERIITKKRLVESRRSEITDQKLSKKLKIDVVVGQRLKIKGQKPELG